MDAAPLQAWHAVHCSDDGDECSLKHICDCSGIINEFERFETRGDTSSFAGTQTVSTIKQNAVPCFYWFAQAVCANILDKLIKFRTFYQRERRCYRMDLHCILASMAGG